MQANDGRCGCLQTIQQAYGAHKWAIAKEEKNSLRNTIAAQKQRRTLISNGGLSLPTPFPPPKASSPSSLKHPSSQHSHPQHQLPPVYGHGLLETSTIRKDPDDIPAPSPVFGGSPNAQVVRLETRLEEAKQRRKKDLSELYNIQKALGQPVGTWDEFYAKKEEEAVREIANTMSAAAAAATSPPLSRRKGGGNSPQPHSFSPSTLLLGGHDGRNPKRASSPNPILLSSKGTYTKPPMVVGRTPSPETTPHRRTTKRVPMYYC